jgi:signal transduction histidine kinase
VKGLRALGLRPRLLGALLLTSVVTLGVAALALLSPLEQRLRADGAASALAATSNSKGGFEHVDVDSVTGLPDADELAGTVSLLRRRSGASVTILDSHLEEVYPGFARDLDVPDYYPQAHSALATKRRVHTIVGEQVVVAEPVRIGPEHYVVILVKRLQYVASAVEDVQKAFIEAAAAGLLIALILGIGLTSRLLRRLERLRDATREVARSGLDATLPTDNRRDEIGELTRAFASMQMQLRRQEAARRAFVATASHELRTPLASLDGMLELLDDDLSGAHLDLEEARKHTTRAKEQARRLTRLAGDLLDLSRLDAEVQLRREPLELGEMCRAVAAEFEHTSKEREVTLEVAPPDRPCWALGDPGAVARIVRILLDNALRVAPAYSSVELAAQRGPSSATITVRDSGPGVAPAERDQIFERFTRGGSTAGASGFGLGLAIGRELAARMEGTLELQGGHGGSGPAGACFVLTLPNASVDAEEHRALTAAEPRVGTAPR